jgi:hypothetical protein
MVRNGKKSFEIRIDEAQVGGLVCCQFAGDRLPFPLDERKTLRLPQVFKVGPKEVLGSDPCTASAAEKVM